MTTAGRGARLAKAASELTRISGSIRQLNTHRKLIRQTEQRELDASLRLDAIIVPASRPAPNLEQAITLARAAHCTLLILCSRQAKTAEVWQLLARRSFSDAMVVSLPEGYGHELLDFPTLASIKDDLPVACSYYVTDLSTKRNVALLLARMLGWRCIFYLDDDIRDISYPDLQSTVSMLGSYRTAGMRVDSFPDNSVVGHAHRMTGGMQDVFVTGSALAVNCEEPVGFFPDIYKADWLFFFDDAANGCLGSSMRAVSRLRFDPFADPQRAAWQEFGDVLAEGLYALLDHHMRTEYATSEYWSYFLAARQKFLEEIIHRSGTTAPEIRERLLLSVESALKCSMTIAPELLERYVGLWRRDLRDWERRVAGIGQMPSLEVALSGLGLALAGQESVTERSAEPKPVKVGNAVRSPAEILSGLDPDTRYFLSRARQGGDNQMSWLFEGRAAEREHIATWLHSARSGVLAVTGPPGCGKSVLLADVLMPSLPDLRSTLVRHGLIGSVGPQEMPQDSVFDAVLHLGGLTAPQVAHRLAAAAAERLNRHLAGATTAAGTAVDAKELDEIAAQLAVAAGSFTVLADGLNEAEDPVGTARSVLARLATISGVRVLIGTRASTREHLGAPAYDQDILDALGVHLDVLQLARDPDATYRYAGRYLRQVQQQAGRDVAAGMSAVSQAELDRAAAAIATQDQEFLFAQLALHEITEDPRLLASEPAGALGILLQGGYEGLFAAAVDRLAALDDRYPVLLQALAQAPAPGLSESDWIWAALAAAPPAVSRPPPTSGVDPAPTDATWTQSVHTLLDRAAPYISADSRTGTPGSSDGPVQVRADAAFDDGPRVAYRLTHYAFAEFLGARDTERDHQHLPAFGHAASADLDSYASEFAGAPPALEAALRAGRLPCSPALVTQSPEVARLAMCLWRLTSVHSPLHHRLLGDAISNSQPADDPRVGEQGLKLHAAEPPRSPPQVAGARLEASVLDLLELLFRVDDDDGRLRRQVRRQQSGTQYGTDLVVRRPTQKLLERGIHFRGAARRTSSTCLVECKNYTSAVTMATVSDKLLQAQVDFRAETVDHWILISPHQDPNNELDRNIQHWNSSRTFSFTVQVWSPQNGIRDLFALMPEIYRDLYGQDPPQPRQDPDRVLAAFAERLQPPVRLPEKLAGYIVDPRSFVRPHEEAWLGQINAQVARFGFDEKGTRLPRPLQSEILSALFESPTGSDVALLLAEFGEGKSFFTVALCVHLQARYLAKPGTGSPIPVRLLLQGYRYASSPADFLRTQLELIGLGMQDWSELLKREKVLVILDGLDEMSVRQDPATTRGNLEKIESLLGLLQGLPVLVTSRPHFLSAAADRERFYDRLRRPHVFRMGQPDRKDIVAHLRAFADTPALTRKLDKLKDLYDPVALASKMLFLDMTKEALPDLPEDHFDEVTLYEVYVTKSLKRKIELLRDPDSVLPDRELLQQLEQLLEQIAVGIHISGEGYVDLRSFTAEAGGAARLLWKAVQADELRPGSDEDATARIGSRSLLRRVATGLGRNAEETWLVDFFHRSMKEYFVAKALQRALQAPDPFDATRQLLAKAPVQLEVLGFFRLLAGHIDGAASILAKIARSASVGSEPGLVGGGAISLHAAIGGRMSGCDWRSLNLDGALLSGADLAGSDLRGSTLRGADLSSADLTGADLRSCDLTEANLAAESSIIAMSPDMVARHYICLTPEPGLGRIAVNADGSLTCSFIRLPGLLPSPKGLFALPEDLILIAGRSEFLIVRTAGGIAEEMTRFRISSELRAVAIVDRSLLGLLVEPDPAHSEALLVGIADGHLAWRIPVAAYGRAYSWCASGVAIAYESEIRAYHADGSYASFGSGRQWSRCSLSMQGDTPVAVTSDGRVAWLATGDSPQFSFVAAHQGAGTAVTTSGSSVLSAGVDGSIALSRRDGNVPMVVSRLERRLRCTGAKVSGMQRERERLAFLGNRADGH